MRHVEENPSLLADLLNDHDQADNIYKITQYWRGYNKIICDEIKQNGLKNLQKNYMILKGFCIGGIPTVIPPKNFLKKSVFNSIASFPYILKFVRSEA